MEVKKGYKQTEIGVIPNEWEAEILGDYSIKIGSGITPTGGEKIYKNKGRHFIRSQNVGWGQLDLSDVAFIDDEVHNTFKTTEIKTDDIFLNITGASIGRSAMADERVTGGNVNQHVCIIRLEQKYLSPKFINYFLLSKPGQKQIDSFQSGGNRQGLNFGQIRKFLFPLPPTTKEQSAIAAVLSETDSLITNLEKLIAKKEAIKKGVMQALLTGKKRLPGFSEKWRTKKLSEIGKPFGGLTGKSKKDFENGKQPYIPFMNVMSNAIIDIGYFDYVTIGSSENQNKVLKGDLLFNGSSETPEEVGMCSVLLNDVPNLYLNSFCFGFRLNRELHANALFLSYFFRSSVGRRLFYSSAQGATRYNLSKNNFLKIEIPFPKTEEQEAIADIIKDLENEILHLKGKAEKFRVVKQGMMQNLLTGKIRLV